MKENISIAQEKSRIRALLNVGILLFVGCGVFWLLSAICFGILDLLCRFDWMAHNESLHVNWHDFIVNPMYIFGLYGRWFVVLLESIRLMDGRWILFTPFVVPAGIIVSVVAVVIFRKFSFSLWFVLNYHFAKIKDIKEMGLDKGLFMVLGRFGEMLLSVKSFDSVLCLGEMGTGKTSSVAIPSILKSDNACIIGVDTTGLLAKYTAGYRSKVGKVMYYNWDLQDDPAKGLFYPRWNPLDEQNIPKKHDDKNAYIKRIAGYLIDIDDKERDVYWNVLANSVVVSFLMYWIEKIKQAKANDYFLNKLISGHKLTSEEKEILLSYYLLMPEVYVYEAIEALEENNMTVDNYVPIGSWGGIPEQWMGKNVCFAAITDWIIYNYMSSTDEAKDWTGWFASLLREAKVFGYGDLVESGIRQVLALSRQQRKIVFSCVIRPFGIFTNQAIRERTNGNDFNLDNVRGVYCEDRKKWVPITLYSLANTHSSKIMNQMFIDEALYRNLHMKENKGPLPVMLVLDNVGHNLRIKNLTNLLEDGKRKKMSALLLCNSLSLVENVYSKQEIEKVVTNTNYKIIKAPDNQKLSRQLDRLASFATKSVQIPKSKKKRKITKRKYYANASYFHKLAMDFNLRKDIKIDTKDHQIVLVEGFYNRPVLAQNVFFAEDDKFKKMAVLDAEYTLEDAMNQNVENTPLVSVVFDDKDIGVEDLVELDQYLNIVFEEVDWLLKDTNIVSAKNEKVEKIVDKTDVLVHKTDWWMDEKSFELDDDKKENPFLG